MKKYIYLTLIAIVSVLGLSFYQANATTSAIPTFMASNTSYACSNGSWASTTPIIATSTSRVYIRLTNTSAVPVYLAMGTPASNASGTPLTNATGTVPYFETNGSSLFGGAIFCYSSSGTSTIAVTEYK